MIDLTNVTMENKLALTEVLNQIQSSGGGGGSTASVDYKEYVAYITQSASAPTALVAKNELGVTVTFSKNSTGDFTITATGAFPTYQKVVPQFNPQSGSPIFWNVYWNDANSLGVNTWNSSGTLADSILVGNLVIRVYN
jgi:hypothetical protein